MGLWEFLVRRPALRKSNSSDGKRRQASSHAIEHLEQRLLFTASVVDPTATGFATSLNLTSGAQTYIYGEVTGGGNTTSPLANGSTETVNNGLGNLGVGLAVTTQPSNSFTTQTAYYSIAGVGVSGYTNMQSYYGQYVNPNSGSISSGSFGTSVTFTLTQSALVVAIGGGSSQQAISFSGVAGLVTDAAVSGTGDGLANTIGIAQASLSPGTYTIQLTTSVTSDGQTEQAMADLLGVYVFTGSASTSSSTSPTITGVTATPTGANNWGLTIQGSGFGSQPPFNGTSPDLSLVDPTSGFSALYTGDSITGNVTSWTDSSIQISDLGGTYGQGAYVIQPGDQLDLTVLNPQTGSVSNLFQITTPPNAYLGLQVSSAEQTNAAVNISGNTVTFTPSGQSSVQYVAVQDIDNYLKDGDNVILETTLGQGIGNPNITIDANSPIVPSITSPVSLQLLAAGNIVIDSTINDVGYTLTNPSLPVPLDVELDAGVGNSSPENITISDPILSNGGNISATATGGAISVQAIIQTYGGDLALYGGTVLLGPNELGTSSGYSSIQSGSVMVFGSSSVSIAATEIIDTVGTGGNKQGGGGGGIIIASGGNLTIGNGVELSTGGSTGGGGGAVLIAEGSATGSIVLGNNDHIDTDGASIGGGSGAVEVYSAGTTSNFSAVTINPEGVYSDGPPGGAGGSVVVQAGGMVEAEGGSGDAAPAGDNANLQVTVPGILPATGGAQVKPVKSSIKLIPLLRVHNQLLRP